MVESEDQMVARYIGGLTIHFQDSLNLFDPTTISEAHQRALQLERQLNRRVVAQGGNRKSSSMLQPHAPTPQVTGKSTLNPQPHRPIPTGASGSTTRCFKCGEQGHRMADCKKGDRFGKGLFIESQEVSPNEQINYEQDLIFDDVDEEHVHGDEGPLLVVRRACLTPRATDDDLWLRNNIFQSTCTIDGKVCRPVIDYESCENVVAEEAVQKLGLATERHPHPYKLSWLKKGTESLLVLNIKIMHGVTLLLWMHVIFYWGDHGNLT